MPAQTSAVRMRAWTGPAVLTRGFRPFFLGGAVWAAAAMALWLGTLSGHLAPPTAFDPVSWHAHELLFGYLGAILAGFLLTAIPNWTGRLPVAGWPLGALVLLWGAGRVAVALSAGLPAGLVAAVDLAFPLVLAAVVLREIVAGGNRHNLVVLLVLAVFVAGNALFHLDVAHGVVAARGAGTRLGLAGAVLMIALIGGRIVPSFTRNWLVRAGRGARPAAPMLPFDKAALALMVLALALWVARPHAALAGAALLAAGAAQAFRLARWQGWRTGAEPLVLVLHAGYAFVPLGALATGLAVFAPDRLSPAAAQHLWMAGGIGLMTLAVMTRASLGHTGRALHAGVGSVLIYLSLLASVALRVAGDGVGPLIALSAVLWIAAFLGFVALHGPLLLSARPGRGRA